MLLCIRLDDKISACYKYYHQINIRNLDLSKHKLQ